MNWQAVLKQELKQIFLKDPRRVIFLFGSSIAYLVFFALLYGTHVINAVPLAVCDEDQTQLSRALTQAFEDSERYRIVAHVSSTEEMEALLRSKEAYAALNIPARFARDIKTGLSSQALVVANGANIAVANAVLTSAQEIIAAFSKNTAASLLQTAGQLPNAAANKALPVELRLRVLHNPTLSYQNYFLLGLAMAALQGGILLAVGAGMICEYANIRARDKVRPLTVITAKGLPYWLLGTAGFVVTLIISVTVFGVPCKGSAFEMLILGAAFAFAIAALGSVLAAICRSEVSYTRVVLTYAVPAFILSGYIWPIPAMDPVSRLLACAFPLTYIADNLRHLMVAGYAPNLWRDVAVLAAMGLLFLAVSALAHARKQSAS